ncbi:MAG: lipopolysaccharide biosynthesis protein RfbH [Chthoniobacterales bacterium]|nr:lipopolysaccharide biosynthesis protein RfbH [Chthoniobacterales bacterium]
MDSELNQEKELSRGVVIDVKENFITVVGVTDISQNLEHFEIAREELAGIFNETTLDVNLNRIAYVRKERIQQFKGELKKETLGKIYEFLCLSLVRKLSRLRHESFLPGEGRGDDFEGGKTVVPYAGRVFGEEEVEAAVRSSLEFWLTLGTEGENFERELANYLGVKKSILTNSGSSANLLAISALTSQKHPKERRLEPGDEVITCAAGFPTTVAPIVQNGAVPVFLDNDPVTGNVDLGLLEEAYCEGKTKAVIFAHTLGNPFDLARVCDFCRRRGLWLIEDNCDALGARYFSVQDGGGHFTGTWGDLSTQSFYPPHHITMGEGGAVNVVRDMKLKVLVESFRDWGRDCWCASGKDNTCRKRFGWQLGELPEGYDHKYIYSHVGYNLKPLDLQAAIGRVQLKRLPGFIEARRRNWQTLRAGLDDLEEFFEFMLPTHAKSWRRDGTFEWDSSGNRSEPSWFGFMLLVREKSPFTRTELARFLDENKIGNRMLFGGNLTRQPAFVELRKRNPGAFRVVGDLKGADRIMKDAVFVGVYPGLTKKMLEFVIEKIHQFVKERVG